MEKTTNPFKALQRIPDPAGLEETVFRRVARSHVRASGPEATIQKIRMFSDVYRSKLDAIRSAAAEIEDASPFYKEVCDAVYPGGMNQLKRDISTMLGSQNELEKLARYYIARSSQDDHIRSRKAFLGRAGSLIRGLSPAANRLAQGYSLLRDLPTIDRSVYRVVVAGTPFVGKSSFVSRVSKVRIPIGHYPFTTKRINSGEIAKGSIRVLFFDTPGLLDRPLYRRSAAEVKAVSALRHISSLILFLVDPTEKAGYSLEYQLQVLESIQAAFKQTEIMKCYTHADEPGCEGFSPRISNLTGEGIDEMVNLILNKAQAWYFEAAHRAFRGPRIRS